MEGKRREKPKEEEEPEKQDRNFLLTFFKWSLFLLALPPVMNLGSLQFEKKQLTDNATLYDIGFGQKLYMACKGEGSPVVLTDSPAGTSSDIWFRFQELLSKHTKVCVYDRAGLGFSDPEPRFNRSDSVERAVAGADPMTLHKMEKDLHNLLIVNPQDGPLVLIGSELGALNLLTFALSFPKKVSHLVMFDPIHPSMLNEEVWKNFLNSREVPTRRMLQLTAMLGLNRLGMVAGLFNPPFSDETRSKHLMTDPFHLSSSAREVENLLISLKQFDEMNSKFSGPTTVITGNFYDELQPVQLNRVWSRAAQNVISAIPGCQHVVINGADHRMIYNKPEEALQPILKILKKTKKT